MRETILIAILTGLMVILMSSSPAFAASETFTSGYYEYTIEDESVSITGYFGTADSIEIPSSIAGYPVSTIKAGAFVGAKDLKVITLPETIMAVEPGAFRQDQKTFYPDSTYVDNKDTSDPQSSTAEPPSNNKVGDDPQDEDIESLESLEPLDSLDESEASESGSSETEAESSDTSKSDTIADPEESTNDSATTEQQNNVNPMIYVIGIVVFAIIVAVLVKLKRKK